MVAQLLGPLGPLGRFWGAPVGFFYRFLALVGLCYLFRGPCFLLGFFCAPVALGVFTALLETRLARCGLVRKC